MLIVALGLFYLLVLKAVDEPYILSYRWKGGACHGLPAILDFRDGALRLDSDNLYQKDKLTGSIVEREYRFHAPSIIHVLSAQTGETCMYWAKWPN